MYKIVRHTASVTGGFAIVTTSISDLDDNKTNNKITTGMPNPV